MRKWKGLLYVVALVAALGCLSGCSFQTKTNYRYQNGEKYTAGDREITEKIETIDIHYMSGDIQFIGSDSDKVTIKETSAKQLDDKRKVHTWVDGTTLYVRYCASADGLEIFNLEKHLEITVPEGVKLGDVRIDVSSGDVEARGFETENMNVSLSSGDLDLDCVAKKYNIKASSGRVNLTQRGECDDLSIQTSSGEITLNAESFAKADIEASSGDVTIYLPEDYGFTADVDMSSGKLYYEHALAKDGDRYICGDGSSQLKLETSSGDINLKVSEK